MKENIHPNYHEVEVVCACGEMARIVPRMGHDMFARGILTTA